MPVAPDYEEIAQRLKDGTIIPFFGAGASRACGLASAASLTKRLLISAHYPDKKGIDDLALAASYLLHIKDYVALHREVRQALCVAADPCCVHTLFVQSGLTAVDLFVTTNYDDLVERALESRKPWVVVDRGKQGSVWCRPYEGAWREVQEKTLRKVIPRPQPPIVFKLHGSIDRSDQKNDSFLITEEDYVRFLGRPQDKQIPSMLKWTMAERSFLFLGYALRDWNVRVLLRQLADLRHEKQGGPSCEKIQSWAIALGVSPAEQELWKANNVTTHDLDLQTFAKQLGRYL
jgi:hypothetical protein